MSLKNYGVLVGHATEKKLDKDSSPHFHIRVSGNGDWDISINVKSGVYFSTVEREGVPPNQVLYLLQDPMDHPLLGELEDLEPGFHPLESKPGGLAVDFIRSNLFDPSDMTPLPAEEEGEDNDLFERIGFYVDRAINRPETKVYVFGEPWEPNDNPNRWFGFTPDQGIHDVHMNQGNDPGHSRDDGVWQDGAVFFRFEKRWVGLFIAFQAQCWHTDDQTGAALAGVCSQPPSAASAELSAAMIIAASANPLGDDRGLESVILLNTTSKDLSLDGWGLLDKNKKREPLEGALKAGEARKIILSGDHCQLSNKGGIITLVDSSGLKVHGVSYTQNQAKKAGITFPF